MTTTIKVPSQIVGQWRPAFTFWLIRQYNWLIQMTNRSFCVNYTPGLQNHHLLTHKRIQSFVKQIGWLLTSTSTRITWLVNINLKRAKEKSTGSTINQGEDFSGERHQYFVSVVFVVKCFMWQDKVNTADSAFLFLIIQSQNQWSGWSGRKGWSGLVWSLL